MTCLFNARAYIDGSTAAPRWLDTPYWVLRAVVGLYASTSCLVYTVQGFRDGGPRVQGVLTAIRAPLKNIENLQSIIFLVRPRVLPLGPAPGSCPPARVRGPGPRDPIWDPIGGCVLSAVTVAVTGRGFHGRAAYKYKQHRPLKTIL